ncbi:MAG: S4 domain-containing protein, partial [Cyanobacteria bacterium P01_H01_bin.130]
MASPKPPASVRLQKLLSQWGVASRRQAEVMIRDGRVQVNGQVATIGDGANPDRDIITVDGIPLKSSGRPNPRYILVTKPRGILCAC